MIAATLARATGRPVKYVEDRIDNITACDNHGSDRIYDASSRSTRTNRMTGLRCKVIDDYGAYFQFGSAITATRSRRSSGRTGSAASRSTSPRC